MDLNTSKGAFQNTQSDNVLNILNRNQQSGQEFNKSVLNNQDRNLNVNVNQFNPINSNPMNININQSLNASASASGVGSKANPEVKKMEQNFQQ